MRRLVLLLSLFTPAVALAATLSIESPSQGDTLAGPSVTMRLRLSDDVALGKTARVQVSLDGHQLGLFSTDQPTVRVPTGTHELRATLVGVDGNPLRITAADAVTVTLPASAP